MKVPVFDRWCDARYFAVANGTAKLVQCTHWRRDLHKSRKQIDTLKSIHPKLESVYTNSWMIHMADEAQRRLNVSGAGADSGGGS